MTLRRASADGRLVVDLSGASFSTVENGSVHLDAKLGGHTLDVAMRAAMGKVGRAELRTSDLEFDGGLLNWTAWKSVRGNVSIDSEVDLAKLDELLPDLTDRLGEMKGHVHVVASISRDDSRTAPDVT